MAKIHEDLAKVMRSVNAVGKGDSDSHQNLNFRGIEFLLNAVGPALREHNVSVVPHLNSVVYEPVVNADGTLSTSCRMTVDYTFYADDGSFIQTRVAAGSCDNEDAVTMKAMGGAFRTALIQTLSITFK